MKIYSFRSIYTPVVILLRSELKGNLRKTFSFNFYLKVSTSFFFRREAYLRRAISVEDPLGLGVRTAEELLAIAL